MKNRSVNALKWIYKYTGRQLWWVVFLSVITGAISLGFIWLALVSSEILDIATGAKSGSFGFAVFKILLIIALQGGLNILYCNILIRAMGKIDIKFKQGLFNCLLNKKWTKINEYHSGELLNRFTSDVDIIINGIISIVPSGIALGTRLIAGLAVLFSIEPKLTVIVVVFGVFIAIASKIYSKHFKYLHKALQSANGVVRSFIQECIENIVVIKSFANNKIVSAALKDKQLSALKLMYKKQTVSNIADTGIYILFTGGYYAALIWGAFKISAGSITFGMLTAFLQIIEQIKAPMRNMSGLVPAFYSMIASSERLIELENLEDELNSNHIISTDKLYDDLVSLNFENITFSYKDDTVLENASTVINKGEFVAIAGPSGIGKSTMMKLILSLIEPQSGNIYLKLKDRNLPIDASCRGLYSYVPQGNMILSGTIRENIAFCRPNATDDEIIKSAKLAMIWSFIETLPEGLNTVIGERGLGLSEGQIQRLAIARAFLCDAPILLLDEATSALDEKTEKGLIENIKSLKYKTCIFISHKHKTIEMCDRIIQFNNKKLRDCSFEDLTESWK
ncbi:MAG: ABC transporter ATP-binding protein [Clostridia bacterium]|nr:ABC transporter ATP-binding protein [Clostridia bacterium]